jgi:hypothetical protein
MKFKGEGNTTVWDAQRDRELCRFEKGELETEDIYVIERLVDLGYEHDGVLPIPGPETPAIDEELVALRAKGKELKIKGAAQMGLEKLTQAIAEAEKGVE